MSDNLPRGNGVRASSYQFITSPGYAEHTCGSYFDHQNTTLANFYNDGTNPRKAHMARCVSYCRYCPFKGLSAWCLVPSVGY